MVSEKKLKVLFLTTQNPEDIRAEWPYYQNWTLPKAIEARGEAVWTLCWQDPTLDSKKLATFDIISFLWCNNYHAYANAFISFVKHVLLPAQELSRSLRVVNDAGIILWNVDKEIYLTDLSASGFLIPETIYEHEVQQMKDTFQLESKIKSFSQNNIPVVLKPSISGSAKQTHLIRNPSQLSPSDTTFLNSIIQEGIDGSLLIQKYEPGIEEGEYSMVFINGDHTHTMIKTPCAGEFRCQAEFGGGIDELALEYVPEEALKVAHAIINHLERNFSTHAEPRDTTKVKGEKASNEKKGATISTTEVSTQLKDGAVYARIDGVVRNDGTFVLMEVEAIEPHLWLETANAPGCREALHKALLGESE